MTIEEKAREYAIGMAACYMTENQALPDDQTINDFTMTFLAGYEEAARWIPVEERLPEWGERVLTLCEKTGSYCVNYLDMSKIWRDASCSEHRGITHWRPIE